jgi:Methyl-accepting chemotaxis protein (MCP) signalling domain
LGVFLWGRGKKVKDGSELVRSTNAAFREVSRSATKVGELVGEIAAASNEQAQGIDQVISFKEDGFWAFYDESNACFLAG